jgi:ring-1,2-phenylacetyl-CoA epoxidase subunit PaaE
MCTYVLQEEKVPKENIRRENFIIQKLPATRPIPPDTEEHQATVVLGGDTYHFPVQYPDSILIAARKQGIQLPYSCEAGRCGNCVAKCTKGKVWLSYNEVLTDRDLSKGLTLTCVGHPIGGNVELSI